MSNEQLIAILRKHVKDTNPPYPVRAAIAWCVGKLMKEGF